LENESNHNIIFYISLIMFHGLGIMSLHLKIYFDDETQLKCLFRIYTKRSINQPNEDERTLSITIKNQEIDYDKGVISQNHKKV